MYTAASAVPSGTCSEVYGAKIAGLRSLQPCRAHQCRTLVPRRRCTASQSGAQQLDSARRHVSSEEAQKGLQYQLDRSVRPAVTQQEPGGSPQEYEQDLRRRRCSAREWITPWLTSKAKSRSVDTMAALRSMQTADLSPQQQDSVLKRLLGKSWQVAAANPVAVWSDGEDNDSDMDVQSVERDKYQSEHSYKYASTSQTS